MKILLAAYGLETLFLLSGALLIWFGVILKLSISKHLCFNLSVVFLCFGLLELVLTVKDKPQSKIHLSQVYYTHHKELGYSVREGDYTVTANKRWKKSGDEIYKASYGLSESRRKTPNSNQLSSKYALFLGGSFMFGEGLNDNETLPYYYNQQFGVKRNIRNYGLSGYGTHQVYSIVNTQIINDPKLSNTVEVYYWFIAPHIRRASGLSMWGRDGPQYRLNKNVVEHTGSFRQTAMRQSTLVRGWRFVWRNSALANTYLWRVISIADEEINLALALLKQTDQVLKTRGFNFTVLIQNTFEPKTRFYTKQHALNKKIKQYLEVNGIQFIDINDVFARAGIDVNALTIKDDGHPKAELNEQLAKYLALKKRD